LPDRNKLSFALGLKKAQILHAIIFDRFWLPSVSLSNIT
jgi:hypothetical protein